VSALEFPERPVGLPERPKPIDERPWSGWWAIPIAFGAVVLGTFALLAVVAIRDAIQDPPVPQPGNFGVALHGSPPVVTFVATLVQDLALIVGAVLVAASALKGRVTAAHFGLRPTRVWSSVGYVVLAYVGFILLAALWTSVMGVQDRENVLVDLGTGDSLFAFLAAAFLTTVVAPAAEEVFFRGFLFGGLRKHGLIVAAGVSGILFGGAHVASSPIGFIVPLAALGIILALLYEKTGSLYVPIGLHALNNSIAFGASDGRAWIIPICLAASGAFFYGVHRVVNRSP
jgi:membrane protease YdiL (CAAX protease family)